MTQNQMRKYHQTPLRHIECKRKEKYYSAAAAQLETSLQGLGERKLRRDSGMSNIVSLVDRISLEGGTAVLLNEFGFLLSCFHQVDYLMKDQTRVEALRGVYINGRAARIDPTFFASDSEHDLALLRVLGSPEEVEPIFLSSQELPQREGVEYFSFANGRELSANFGQVCRASYDVYFPTKERIDSLAFYGESQRGFSGAPLFNQRGELVGNLFGAGEIDGEEVNFATKGKYICALLQDVIAHLQHIQKE